MPCPTCSATLDAVSVEKSIWQCSRCGTMVMHPHSSHPHVTVPALVVRCRRFYVEAAGALGPDARVAEVWRRVGIAESIALPEDRPS